MSTSFAITVIFMSLMFVIAGQAAGYFGSHGLSQRNTANMAASYMPLDDSEDEPFSLNYPKCGTWVLVFAHRFIPQLFHLILGAEGLFSLRPSVELGGCKINVSREFLCSGSFGDFRIAANLALHREGKLRLEERADGGGFPCSRCNRRQIVNFHFSFPATRWEGQNEY
jgi:hypothetical protein